MDEMNLYYRTGLLTPAELVKTAQAQSVATGPTIRMAAEGFSGIGGIISAVGSVGTDNLQCGVQASWNGVTWATLDARSFEILATTSAGNSQSFELWNLAIPFIRFTQVSAGATDTWATSWSYQVFKTISRRPSRLDET